VADMWCFKAELDLVEQEKRDTITLYREPGIGQGKVIRVRVYQPEGRSLLG
jgi:hypothetical protein